MRSLAALLVGLLACSHPQGATTPAGIGSGPTTGRPASDLASAKGQPAARDEEGKLVVRDPRVTDLDIIKIKVDPKTGETTTVATADLFRQAGEAVKAGKTQEAMGLYRQIVTDFPDSSYGPISLFNIAAIFDGRGDYPATVDALQELVTKYPDSRESVEGHLYIAALHADHKDFAKASTVLDAVIARGNLSYADRVEANARKGYVELELGHLEASEAACNASIAAWRQAPRLEDNYYIAMAAYYLGEIAHKQFEQLVLRLPDEQLLKDADQKRVLAARAYDRWKDSLQHHQPYWATAAGYQMSQIFYELWHALVTAPYPNHVAPDARKVYVTELHDKTREHLEKALEGHRMNVELAKAYGVDTAWSKGSAIQVGKLLEELAKDSSGVFVTP